MQGKRLSRWAAIVALTLAAPSLWGALEPNDKVLRYLKILERRPGSGYLFDRFYNAWLETESVKELEQFLKQRAARSEDANAMTLLALFYEKEGDEVKALETYTESLRKAPGSGNILYHKASLEVQTLDFESGIAGLNLALKQQLDRELSIKIHKLLGKAYLRNDQEKEALATWEALLTTAPGDQDLKEDIMELQLTEGLFDEALTTCKELLGATTNNYKGVMLQLRLGDIHQRAGQKAKALEAYRATLEKIGANSWLEKEVLAQIEQVFRMEDDITGLKRYHKKLLETYPKRLSLLKRLAMVLNELGETNQAIDTFKQLLRLTPGNRANKEQYVQLLLKADELQQAVEAAEELSEQYPKDGEILIRLGRIQNRAGKKQAARRTALKYLRQSDKSEFAYLRTARLLVSFAQTDEATTVYEELIQAHPESLEGREARAGHLYSIGKKEQGRKALLEIAEGADLQVLLRVANGLLARGEHEIAYDLLRKRENEFGDKFVYLTHLYRSALAGKKTDEGLGYALKRLEKASRLSELEGAVADAAATADKAKKLQDLTEQLLSRKDRTVGETCLLAEMLDREGRMELTEKILTKGLSDRPESVLLWSQRFRLARRHGEWEQAMAALEKLLSLQPKRRTRLLQRLVDVALKSGAYDKALGWIADWKRHSPGSYTPYVTEARIYWSQDEYGKAIDTLRAARLKFPDNQDVLRNLAHYYVMNDSYEQASRIYWKMLETTTDLSKRLSLVTELARISEMQGKTRGLVRHFETRMATNKQSIFPPLALATIYRHTDNYEERRRYLLKAAQLRPSDVPLLHEIARIEQQEGDYDRARATLEKALPLDKTPRTRQRLARLYLLYGEEEKSYQLLLELLGDRLMDPSAAEAVADGLIATGRHEQAVQLLKEVLPSFPKDYRLGFLHAVALEESDSLNESVAAFVDLLEIKEELPGRSSPGASPLQAVFSYQSQLGGLLPSEALEIMKMEYIHEMVYAYRRERGRMYSYGLFTGQSSTTGVVPLPPSVSDLPTYVIGHLTTLADQLDEQQVDSLTRSLESRGIDHAELKLKIVGKLHEDPGLLEELHEEYPDDETVTVLWLTHHLFEDRAMEVDELRKVFKQLKAKYPEFSSMVALRSISSGGGFDEEIFTETIETIRSIEKPNPYIMMGILQTMATGLGPHSQLNEASRKKLRSAVLELYPRMPRQAGFSPWMLQMLVGVLSQDDDYRPLLQFLESEIAQHKPTKRGSPFGPYFGPQYQEGLLQPLVFPPQEIPGFPGSILALFSERAGIFGMGPFALESGKLEPLLTVVKHPILKILLTAHLDKEEQADKLVDKLLEEKKPQLGHLLLGACWKAHQGKDKEVVQILTKARYLPMPQSSRKSIDGAVLAHALELREDPKMLEVARQGALRLRRQRLTPSQRKELSETLSTLGLTKEAKRLEASIPPGITRPPRIGPPIRVDTDQVTKLLRKGKREQAARLLVRNYRSMVSQLIKPARYSGISSYEMRELYQKVLRGNLKDLFLKQLDPGPDSESPRKLLELAYALELFKQRDRARSTYEKVLKTRPNDHFANVRMGLLVMRTDEEKAWSYLEKASGKYGDLVGSALAEELEERRGPSPPDKVVGVIVRLLESKKDDKRMDFEWAQEVFRRLEPTSGYPRHIGVSYVYPVGATQPVRQVVEKKKIDPKRLTTYRKLCDAALQVPQLTRSAFAQKSRLQQEGGITDAELFRDAQTAILSHRESGRMATLRTYISSDSERAPEIPPEVFLVSYAVKYDKGAELDAFLGKLKTGKYRSSVRTIDRLRVLRAAQNEEFIKLAKTYIKQQPSKTPFPPMRDDALCHVIQIWSDRKEKPSLTPLVLDTVREMMSGGQFGWYLPAGASTAPKVWAQKVFESEGQEGLLAYLDELSRLFIKTRRGKSDTPTTQKAPTTRKTRVRRIVSRIVIRGRGSISQADRRTEAYRGFLASLLSNKELAPTVLVHLGDIPELLQSREGMHGAGSMLTWRIKEALERGAWRWELLKETPLVKDWEGFRALPLPDNTSALEIVWEHLRRQPRLEVILDRLKDIQPQTFGAGLLITLLESGDPQATRKYLSGHLDKIRQADPSRRKDLMLALKNLRDGRPIGPDTSGDAKIREFLDLYRQTVESEGLDDLKTFMQRKITSGDTYSYLEEAARTVTNLIPADETKAEQIYQHAIKTVRDFERKTRSRGYSPDTSSEERLISTILQNGPDLAILNFISRKVQAKDSQQVGLDTINAVQRCFERHFLKRTEEISSEILRQKVTWNARELKALQKFLPNMNDAVEGIHVPKVPFVMKHLAERMASADCKAALQWATQQDKADSLFFREALVNLEMWQQEGPPRERKTPKSMQEFYAGLLQNKQLSPMWRVAVYQDLVKTLWLSPDIHLLVPHAVRATLELGEKAELNEEIWGLLADGMNRLLVTDEWKDLAAKFCGLWRNLGLTARRGYPARSHGGGRSQQVAVRMLLLHLKLEDQENTSRILRHTTFQLSKYVPTYALALGYSQDQWLVANLRDNWHDLIFTRKELSKYPLTTGMRKHADEIIAAMPSEELRCFADILYATFPLEKITTKDQTRKSSTTQQEKLEELSERFPEVHFENPQLRKRCFLLLPYTPKLKSEFVEQFGNIDPGVLFLAETSEDELTRRGYLNYLLSLLEGGQFEQFKEKLQNLASMASLDEDDWTAQEHLSKAVDLFNTYLFRRTEGPKTWTNSPRELLTLGKELVALLGLDQNQRHNVLHQKCLGLLRSTLVLHYVCNEPDEAQKWISELGKKHRAAADIRSPDNYVFLFGIAARSAQGKNVEELTEGLLALYSPKGLSRRNRGTLREMGRLSRLKMIKEDELLKKMVDTALATHEARMFQRLKDNPKDRVAQGELLSINLEGRDLKKAEEVYRKMLEISPSGTVYSRYVYCLSRNNQPQRAIKVCLEALEKFPNNQGLQSLLMRAYRRVGQHDKAIEVCQAVLKQTEKPRSRAGWYMQIAFIYRDKKMNTEAEKWFRKILEETSDTRMRTQAEFQLRRLKATTQPTTTTAPAPR